MARGIFISIHALLAESDCPFKKNRPSVGNFYPRSPCGERRRLGAIHNAEIDISIHALLAESDGGVLSSCFAKIIFLSTLSLRRATGVLSSCFAKIIFLSTLSLRRATTPWPARLAPGAYFYPRSPCGERPKSDTATGFPLSFLSTLSLRRATGKGQSSGARIAISIHALLAESDRSLVRKVRAAKIFLSTLSLRRATHPIGVLVRVVKFLSTLSLRRATRANRLAHAPPKISIHALLAESDRTQSASLSA